MLDIEYSVIASDFIKSFDCNKKKILFFVMNMKFISSREAKNIYLIFWFLQS